MLPEVSIEAARYNPNFVTNLLDEFGKTDQRGANAGGVHDISQAGMDFIKGWEKYYNNAYDATGRGDWTNGWGHKMNGESYPNGITKPQAQALYLSDLRNKAIDPINKYFTAPLNQQQFDALASYVFNSGVGNTLIGTNLIRYLNNGNYSQAVLQMDIVTGGGMFLQGLQNRRTAEQNIWNNGIYNSNH